MRVDPITDFLAFLTKPFYSEPDFLHYIYIVLAIASLVIAVAVLRSQPARRTPVDVARFVVRFILGSFWWQQTLWKFPTDTGGLLYWTQQEVEHSAFLIQGTLVKTLILPMFQPFAYGVYGFEAIVAIMLLLGLYTRVVSFLGAGLIFSLFLGLYRAPQEWPWSYVFLVILMLLMVVEDYGSALGLDAFRTRRGPTRPRLVAARY